MICTDAIANKTIPMMVFIFFDMILDRENDTNDKECSLEGGFEIGNPSVHGDNGFSMYLKFTSKSGIISYFTHNPGGVSGKRDRPYLESPTKT
jgi:hypothetical protein